MHLNACLAQMKETLHSFFVCLGRKETDHNMDGQDNTGLKGTVLIFNFCLLIIVDFYVSVCSLKVL